jgi:hypothetical protein
LIKAIKFLLRATTFSMVLCFSFGFGFLVLVLFLWKMLLWTLERRMPKGGGCVSYKGKITSIALCIF